MFGRVFLSGYFVMRGFIFRAFIAYNIKCAAKRNAGLFAVFVSAVKDKYYRIGQLMKFVEKVKFLLQIIDYFYIL